MDFPSLKFHGPGTSRAKRAYTDLVREWDGCTKCPLHERRTKMVHCRGTLPCDLLFVGEAPGRSENAAGIPFTGDAGQLLDRARPGRTDIIQETCDELSIPHDSFPSYAIVNLVACIPEQQKLDGSWDLRPPTKSECATCRPRLRRLLEIASPTAVILLGRAAAVNFRPLDWPGPVLELYHPAYCVRQGGTASTAFRKTVLQLTQFLRDLQADGVLPDQPHYE